MATVNGIKGKEVVAKKSLGLTQLLAQENIQNRFRELLGRKSAGFISSLISVCRDNKMLSEADPYTILGAASKAAVLDLPIENNLGHAYIVPYKNGRTGKTEAQFQLGWKGYVQLAVRSGQYARITRSTVYEGEIESYNRFTDDLEFGERTGNKVIGYLAYFRLVSGYEKYLYMTHKEMEEHAKKYSQSYRKGFGVWVDNFNAMAEKTVLKLLISRYGIMSIDMPMAAALQADGAVIRSASDGREELQYVDNSDAIDGEYEEIPFGDVDMETGELFENK